VNDLDFVYYSRKRTHSISIIARTYDMLWCSGKFETGGMLGSSLPLPSLPLFSLLFPFLLLTLVSPLPCPSLLSFFPSLYLEVGPLNPAKGSGNAVRSLSRVWGRAPTEIIIGAF